MKTIRIFLLLVFAASSALTFANDDSAAEVLNWGHDRLSCSATCDGGVECVVGGKATQVVTNETALLVCADAEWIFEAPQSAARGIVDCGDFGTGKYVITPSGVVNFSCHVVFD